MLRISMQNEALTSIGIFKLKTDTGDVLEHNSTEALEQIPGLLSRAVYLSDDGKEIAEYSQWQNLAAFNVGMESIEYRHYLTSIVDEEMSVHRPRPCKVIFVDDARPGTDQFDAMILSEKDDFISMISVYEVKNGKRDELIDLLQRDHESFLRDSDGFIAIAFYKDLGEENKLIEVTQYESTAKFAAVSKTPRTAAHTAAIGQIARAHYDIYRVQAVFARDLDNSDSG